MKQSKTLVYIIGLGLSSVVVIATVSYFANRFLTSDSKARQSVIVKCTVKGSAHAVSIQNNFANPSHTDGKLCDTLTITNADNQVRLMAFGSHEDHIAYDGVIEKQLSLGQSLTVTLNQTGTFQFHDHIGDVAHGDFTVVK